MHLQQLYRQRSGDVWFRCVAVHRGHTGDHIPPFALGVAAARQLLFCRSGHARDTGARKLEGDRHLIELHFADVDHHDVDEHAFDRALSAVARRLAR